MIEYVRIEYPLNKLTEGAQSSFSVFNHKFPLGVKSDISRFIKNEQKYGNV